MFLATRPKFFTSSVLPVFLGTAWGYKTAGSFNSTSFILAIMATILIHAATNVLNDVYDELTGNDGPNEGRIYPYTGGSRFIQNGIMDVGQMRRWGFALLVVGILTGLLLANLSGVAVIGFGLAGVALGVLYSAPPFRLSGRGLGELAVAVGFGPLPVIGAVWLQTGAFSVDAVLLSIPVGIWIANVLLINEVPDATADAAADSRTLVVRLNAPGTAWLYFAGQAIAAIVAIALSLSGLLPIWSGPLLLLTLIPAWKAMQSITAPSDERDRLRAGIEGTLFIHAVGSLVLIGSILATTWV
ncbi:MAG: prenyltransferase [Rhodospirillaceae bacterium]|nr:prenyltransferase [Rhodospirillaceae bacterium]